jgi:preprotein translocase subunit SecE
MAKVDKKKVSERGSRAGEPAAKPSASSPQKSSSPSSLRKTTVRFFANLLSTERYKPNQGFIARVSTAAGLGFVFAVGLWRFSESLAVVTVPAWVSQPYSRIGIPFVLALLAGWFVFRLVNQEDFSEFLIATEAEMNKVSWTTWSDLKRATSVVLVTVVLMTTYLWLVDQVWSTVLTWIGVIRI